MSWNQRFYGKNPFSGAFGARGGRQPQGEPEESRRPGRKFPAKAGIGIAAVILLALVGMNAYYVLDEEKMRLAKSDLVVLHPLPRVDEITVGVDDGDREAAADADTEALGVVLGDGDTAGDGVALGLGLGEGVSTEIWDVDGAGAGTATSASCEGQ